MKRWLANTVSTLVAVIVGALTIHLSLKHLKKPDGTFEWIVLILSGLTTGTIGFFMTWGHFQKEPEPEINDSVGQPVHQKSPPTPPAS